MNKFILLPITFFIMQSANAALPLELMHQPLTKLTKVELKETQRELGSKNTLHVRAQQTYAGYPVWGADVVLHIPHGEKAQKNSLSSLRAGKNTKVNGKTYENLGADLNNAPSFVFEKSQAEKALNKMLENYQHKIGGKGLIPHKKSELMVYVAKDKKAHWAFKVNFFAAATKSGATPSKPTYIIDAITFEIYKEWNDLHTVEVKGGGHGGNKKMGKLIYDGSNTNLESLNMTRRAKERHCLLKNSEVIVTSDETRNVLSFNCKAVDPNHNQVYWNDQFDAVNDGYSPGNDALFGGNVVKHLYQDWYHIPVLVKPDGDPMKLDMVVHADMENAYWDRNQMVFGDGENIFYPLTSVGVAAHEISHGFTEQHSNLIYWDQSGAMNEAFSDMAAQAAEFYAYGKNSWQIGNEIMKAENEALRYMDKPSKDCAGRSREVACSIDYADEHYEELNVHFGSGIYNRAFYLLATSPGWDVRKAFDVMVTANRHYWTQSSNFKSGAWGVLQAANDLGYDPAAVVKAFRGVGVETV